MMKKLLFATAIILLTCSHTRAEELKWHSWNEGYELSKKESKPMLIFLQAGWCNMCKRLDEKTFHNESVIPVINKNFIPVKLDVESKEEYSLGDAIVTPGKLLKSLSIDTSKGLSIPTTVIWNADSKKAKVIAGLLDPDEMKKLLSKKVKK